MKTMSQTSALNPSVLILAALAAVIVFVTLRGSALPLFSNLKVNLAILLVLGMAICAQGGIGRVAAAGQWAHPLAILGLLYRRGHSDPGGGGVLQRQAASDHQPAAGFRHHRCVDGRENR